MHQLRRILALVLAVSLGVVAAASAAVLEVPANGGDASGIGYFSGWKCPPNDNISVVVDGGTALPVPSRVARGDTAGVCGNDGRNGFIAQINFNLYGEGTHTAVVRQNGVAFAQSTFHVETFGTTFLTGAAGTCQLANFPSLGQNTTVAWVQGQQNFVITSTGSSVPGTQAAVRFANELVCNDTDFVSTIAANGYQWSALSGTVSAYQVVQNRTSLGPFVETNSTVCGDVTYPFTLPIPSGRAYTLLQTFASGAPFLAIQDDGPIQVTNGVVQLPDGETAVAATEAAASGGIGVAAPGTGTFSAR
jgi:hypothetical protein